MWFIFVALLSIDTDLNLFSQLVSKLIRVVVWTRYIISVLHILIFFVAFETWNCFHKFPANDDIAGMSVIVLLISEIWLQLQIKAQQFQSHSACMCMIWQIFLDEYFSFCLFIFGGGGKWYNRHENYWGFSKIMIHSQG